MSGLQSSTDFYLTVREPATSSLKDTGSRFLGLIYPVSAEAEAIHLLNDCRKKYYDATHHCYAWRIRNLQTGSIMERSSDDGEPSGTAGRPILAVLEGAGLSNVMLIVVRWFGGTKLGTGGLVRAYTGSAKVTLESSGIIREFIYLRRTIIARFDQISDLMRLFQQFNVKIFETTYSEFVTLDLGILPSLFDQIHTRIRDQFRNEIVLS